MQRKTLLLTVAVAIATLFLATTGWADIPAPPANQDIGLPDVLAGDLTEADCRVCHSSGVPDRHHGLYNSAVPDPSLVPYPQFNTDDGAGGFLYSCMSCHSDTFILERDCLACHNAGSPHHTTADAVALECANCHGDLVDNVYDGHEIPTYSPSLVTPYRGLNGDGYENAPWPTKDTVSDGFGTVLGADLTQTTAGPPFFTVTNFGTLPVTYVRNEPNRLKFKPAGDHNDIFIGSTHHGGEEYTVMVSAGPFGASWDAGTQTLSISMPTSGVSAGALVDEINTATGVVDVEAVLGYDGGDPDDPANELLADTHYEPLGGLPTNSRGFGAGSCSYCHDNDGNLDANGDPMGPIWDNHTLHHDIGLPFSVSDGAGGTKGRCDVCHERATAGEQSGPNFEFAIRHCENCHGPDSLHNIQADSPNTGNIGTVVVGGEDAGYGHVGRDAGPGDSDCWGCHGFGTAAEAPMTGPIVPMLYTSDLAVVSAGKDTKVVLSGAALTNQSGATLYESDVRLTAADGSSVTLEPDAVDQATLTVTIPAGTRPGNYKVQATKSDVLSTVASNPAALSVVPKVDVTRATSTRRGAVTITGSGFGGYAAGSGTSVSTVKVTGGRRYRSTATDEARIISWTDTRIVAAFRSPPSRITVNTVFGTDTARVSSTAVSKRKR